MKKLKLQFILFFLLLSATLAFLLINSYRQMAIEEKSFWERSSEKTYRQMEIKIEGFLSEENERSFSEYRYYQTIPGLAVNELSLNISPLARNFNENDPKGIIGYFQVDPDGFFSTPYLPVGNQTKNLKDESKRKKRIVQIEKITESFRKEISSRSRFAQNSEPIEFKNEDVKEKNRDNLPKALPSSASDSTNLISQNQGTNSFDDKKDSAPPEKETVQKDQPALQSKRKEITPNQEELKTFEKQNLLENLHEIKSGGVKTEIISSKNEKKLSKETSPKKEEVRSKSSSLWIDPFQTRLVSTEYLVFYRKIWLDQKLYLQGFVVKLTPFYQWMIQQTFSNSNLAPFSIAKLEYGNMLLAQTQSRSTLQHPTLLFERSLNFPLNFFTWKIYIDSLPQITTRFYLNLFTAIIILLTTVGLYFVYRTASAQVILSQKRQDFVSAVTHELKTPLTSIRMYSEMLEDGWIKDPEKKQEYFHQINKESGRLTRLIENVLQLARLEKQTYKINPKIDSPKEDLEEFAKEFKRIAEEQDFIFFFSFPEKFSSISYESEALKQVLLSILENSLKFSSKSKTKKIELKIFETESQVIFEWMDYGPGVPNSELKKIFEKFYRVENELTRQTKGTGIGLAMAKIMVESMNGKIEARNIENTGLLIRILFPKIS